MQSKATVSYQGGKQRYTFPFPYLSRQFVKVRYEGGSGTTNLEYNREYSVEGQSVLLRSVAPENVTVYVYRQTPTSSLVDFNDGSLLLASAMDKMAAQLLHVEEENSDFLLNSAMVTDDDGAWQGRGRRIKNIRDPQQPQDVVTLNYLDGVGVARQDELLRIEQAVRADKERALSFKNDAASSAQSAASSATNSAQSCAASEASRQASAESESKIKNMQVDVHAMQNHVDEVKTAIDGVAARAKADGQTASAAAVQAQNSAGASAQSAVASEASAKRAEAAAKFEGVIKSENLSEKSVHKQHLSFEVYDKAEVDSRVDAKINKSGDTMTGNLYAPTFEVSDGYIGNYQRDTGDAITNNGGANVNIASWFGVGFYSTEQKRYTGTMNLRNGDWRTIGAMTAQTFYSDDWFRVKGNSGFYFQDHGGGWYMSDNDWIRAYNGKHIYTSGKMRCDGGFEGTLRGKADSAGNSDNLGGQSLQWIINQINAAKTGIVAGNLAQNGWVKFANGLIVQWGIFKNGNGAQRVSFPISFSSKIFHINFSSTIASDQAITNSAVQSYSLTGAELYGNTSPAGHILWFALGI